MMGLVFIDLALELISLLLELKVETDLNYQKIMVQNALPYCLLKFVVPVIGAVIGNEKGQNKSQTELSVQRKSRNLSVFGKMVAQCCRSEGVRYSSLVFWHQLFNMYEL